MPHSSPLLTRRTFIKLAGSILLWNNATIARASINVNDIHSQLNSTWVSRISRPRSLNDLKQILKRASANKDQVALCGGRHAGGGQQFRSDGILIDTTALNRVLNFDSATGRLSVEAGITWPEIIAYLYSHQSGSHQSDSNQSGTQSALQKPWGVRQKQTGTDELTIGGTLSANAHGQGLRFSPFISDVESFVLIDAKGDAVECNRNDNSELFRLAIGGYGLFGVIYSVTLRLVPRQKLERLVAMIDVDAVIPHVEKSIESGFLYGDFQFNIDEHSNDFLRNGIFTDYREAKFDAPITSGDQHISSRDWLDFVTTAHINKHDTFDGYARYYRSTAGLVNWMDKWQASTYIPNYHKIVDRRLKSKTRATEVLTELYVPRKSFSQFVADVREDFLKNNVNLVYSTVRFIESDPESFLAWAKEQFVCVIFNLHTVHTKEGIEHSAKAFRRLIDLAIKYGGSYYLTYHKFASREQLTTCYPRFSEFLQLKKRYDPDELFQSDWYRHYKALLA